MFTLDELESQLYAWLEPLVKLGQINWKMQCRRIINPSGNDCVRVVLFTSHYEYYITASTNDFLCCGMTSRTRDPGEEHHRGNDVSDGPFTEDTWKNILLGILRVELIAVSDDAAVSRG